MVAHRSVFTLALLLATALSRSAAQPAPSAAPLSVEDIVKLSKEGISEDVLVAKIKKNGKAFDLSPDELVERTRSVPVLPECAGPNGHQVVLGAETRSRAG